ncbi:hypothetical protein ABZS66_56490 [Dactylosporangium sp. NPDC005572]|uniref:hypothetical protein n=1 Tax=Dactylosporangium sp. NPDC005572 TaxID=3156889 RepID=UPI0033BE47E0
MEQDLVTRLDRWTGPGAVVFNGDTFELWGEPDGSVTSALDAHPDLTSAVRRFTNTPGREAVVLVGNHDGPIAWDGVSAEVLAVRLGAQCALTADLAFTTPLGTRVVRCEHGHAFDPANRFADPRNPLDSPLGQHIVQEVLPEVRCTPLLTDVSALGDPNAIGRYIASRLVYRQLGRHLWWLLVPVLLTVLLRIPATVRELAGHAATMRVERWTVLAGLGIVAETGLLLVAALLLARNVYKAMASSRFGPRGLRLNAIPKAAAAALCGAPASGLAGLITGHTTSPSSPP